MCSNIYVLECLKIPSWRTESLSVFDSLAQCTNVSRSSMYVLFGVREPLCLSSSWALHFSRLFFLGPPPCQPGWPASPFTCNGLWLLRHMAGSSMYVCRSIRQKKIFLWINCLTLSGKYLRKKIVLIPYQFLTWFIALVKTEWMVVLLSMHECMYICIYISRAGVNVILTIFARTYSPFLSWKPTLWYFSA
jgi:hypothetical protein